MGIGNERINSGSKNKSINFGDWLWFFNLQKLMNTSKGNDSNLWFFLWMHLICNYFFFSSLYHTFYLETIVLYFLNKLLAGFSIFYYMIINKCEITEFIDIIEIVSYMNYLHNLHLDLVWVMFVSISFRYCNYCESYIFSSIFFIGLILFCILI